MKEMQLGCELQAWHASMAAAQTAHLLYVCNVRWVARMKLRDVFVQ
jgi:hypothetical protein